jgi:hypothetical protein
MHQKLGKYANSSSLDAKQLKVLKETHWKLKDRLGDQRGGSEREPIKTLLEGD